MTNEQKLFPFIKKFYNKLKKEDFILDKSGNKIIELIAPKIELNPEQSILDFKVKKTNIDYLKKELSWYLSNDLSIINHVDIIQIWNNISSKDGKKEVNSNYGWCLFSKENHNQYDNCLNELLLNNNSRRAIMIYNRPSMQYDYKRNGMDDFICCLQNQFFIRNNKLISIVEFRSNDFFYGFFNDFYWKCYIYNKLYLDLKIKKYNNLKIGKMIWIANSFHIYEKHFPLLEKIYLENL